MPTVSIVVPNYNHSRFLPKRIESVLRQTYQDFELVLLDDCSTDESRTILSRYASNPRVRLEFNKVNSGTSFKQWNTGVRMARGEYVWIAESDDYADEPLLERLVGILESDSKISYAYCRSWRVNGDGEVDGLISAIGPPDLARWSSDYVADGKEECRLYFVRGNVVPNASAVVFRKSAYDAAGGADEHLRVCGDWKLWAAMALQGKVAYVSEPLNYYRFHGATVRAKSEKDARLLAEAFQIVNWVMKQVPAARVIHKRNRAWLADAWVPALLSSHVPVDVKRAIVRELRYIDPFPFSRLAGPVLLAMWLKIRKHWREIAAHSTSAGELGGVGK